MVGEEEEGGAGCIPDDSDNMNNSDDTDSVASDQNIPQGALDQESESDNDNAEDNPCLRLAKYLELHNTACCGTIRKK